MEVHHHPQLMHKAKPWKEYFLEYLMIVLAVVTGFFAESLREHIGDMAKEKEYLSSMVNELKYDTAQYNMTRQKIFYLTPLLDSLFYNVKQAAAFNYTLVGKWNTPINETRLAYVPTIATIQQLKSSGNLRLIQSKPVLKKIMEYESFVEGIMKTEAETISTAEEKIYGFEDEMCDETEFNKQTNKNMRDSVAQFNMQSGAIYEMPIAVREPAKLNQFANSFINYKSRNWGYLTQINKAQKTATALIKVINEEYSLKSDE